MRDSGLVLALLLLPCVAARAQIPDRSLIITFTEFNFNRGLIVHFDPRAPGAVSTLASNVTAGALTDWVRMAPNNTDLVVGETLRFTTGSLAVVDPRGNGRLLATGLPGGATGFELDGDDTWVVTASAPGDSRLLGVGAASGTVTTFHHTRGTAYNDVAVVGEGGVRYAVANYMFQPGGPPQIFGADRRGVVTTIVPGGGPLAQLSALEKDPRTGDLIAATFGSLHRVTLAGKTTRIGSFSNANAMKLMTDDTLWVVGDVNWTNAVMRFDLATHTVVTTHVLTSLMVPANWFDTGIEVYGSRVLAAHGRGGPGAVIPFTIQSRHPLAGGAGYQLALSTGERPGVKLPGGEWLHLDVTDPLFLLTARNLLPLARNFAGTLDGSGRNPQPIQLQLPASFPANLGLTIYCAAVLFRGGGVIQVSSPHWFEL